MSNKKQNHPKYEITIVKNDNKTLIFSDIAKMYKRLGLSRCKWTDKIKKQYVRQIAYGKPQAKLSKLIKSATVRFIVDEDKFVRIPGFMGYYKINRQGTIISTSNIYPRIMSYSINNCGYEQICLMNKDNKQVVIGRHKALALTFLSNPDNLTEIDHIDRNKLNNELSNLRWCTRSENCLNRPPVSEETRRKMSESQKVNQRGPRGPHSEETRRKMSESQKGKLRGPQRKVTCPHCGKEGGANAMKQWHFSNCKVANNG